MTASIPNRIVCHFSCGAASAVAAKLILDEFPHEQVVIANAFVKEEHPDNRRFLADCEKWFAHPITVLRDEKFGASTYVVWQKKRFMKGMNFAPCSKALKGDLLDAIRLPGDIDVIGYTLGEELRLKRFFARGSSFLPFAPLIEMELTKDDCYRIVQEAGIRLPKMYELGYNNANCIGCVKGGQGYWNKIRRDFPAEFNAIADIQESIGPGAYLFRNRATGERFSLRDNPLNAGRYSDEPPMSCGFTCEVNDDWDKEEPK